MATRTWVGAVVLSASVVALVCAVGASGAARHVATASSATLTIYSQTRSQQFLDHADDRSRGIGNNPFGGPGNAQPTTGEAGKGPFPGDAAVFLFNLYSDASHTKRIGSATFACQYGFNQNVYCDVQYTLKGGAIAGGGSFSFKSSDFRIAIQGGTGKYQGVRGQVEVISDPSSPQSQAVHLKVNHL